jgi:retron-type reverse transcriptase
LFNFLSTDVALQRNYVNNSTCIDNAMSSNLTFQAASGIEHWKILRINTVGELGEWLGIHQRELDWFADLRNLNALSGASPLCHYRYRVLAKRFGQVRMIESPKIRLKKIQRRILWQLLDDIPLHPSAHGFRRGHSIRTFAEPHVGQQVVLRIDLENFFATVTFAKVLSLFRTTGYPNRVAMRLAGICTNITPQWAWHPHLGQVSTTRRWQVTRPYNRPHLPQGAPTSPALANLAAYRMDCRLAAYAEASGAQYTRYADDLVFSGDKAFARFIHRFQIHAAAIVLDEGFAINHHKTRTMRAAGRQRIAGIVINKHPNVLRQEFDLLKAILTNCMRHGWKTQNRTQHPDFRARLMGRIEHVKMINPNRAQRLLELFDRIAW